MEEEHYVPASEATASTERTGHLSPNKLVGTVCSLCEQSLQATLHSAGLPTEERERIMRNYRSNVEKAFRELRGPKHG